MIGLEKIMRKDKSIKPTTIEEEVAKQLINIEIQTPEIKGIMKAFGFLSAAQYKINDKTTAILITIPQPLLAKFLTIAKILIPKLESQFHCPILVIAKRKIISRHIKVKRTQAIPRSRTLTAVHKAILDDLIYPFTILDKRERVKTDGTSVHKICFTDKAVELLNTYDKKQAIEHIYKALTCKTLVIDFIHVESKLPKKKKTKEEKEHEADAKY